MEIKELLQQAEERMNKSIEALKHEFASIRTGRASVALLDKVMVDYYGSPSPINQVANISVPEPRMIVIAPWDKTMIGAIEKAILQSDLGLNPGNDGAQIRLTIPQLTEERRKEIVKVVHKKAEDAKVAVEIFVDRVQKYIGQYVAVMNGVDAIVFTAGIGENSKSIRSRIINGLTWFGCDIDPERNDTRSEAIISSEGAKVTVLNIPTNEEVEIARDIERLRK